MFKTLVAVLSNGLYWYFMEFRWTFLFAEKLGLLYLVFIPLRKHVYSNILKILLLYQK